MRRNAPPRYCSAECRLEARRRSWRDRWSFLRSRCICPRCGNEHQAGSET
ncbi:hypothetical protein [Anaeromyxobacter paludicola]|nr:hypothetical protein [Anaeromyxobacter paludicola]